MLYTLLFGVFLVPVVEAGFFSALLSKEAAASTETSPENSQTMALLQANVSSAPVFKDKKTASKDAKGSKQAVSALSEDEIVNIASENALVPTASPQSISAGVGGADDDYFADGQLSVYVVRKGDTVDLVADMFGVSSDTILSANDMKKGEKLKEGDILLILPFSGVEHDVVKNDTLDSIARKYKVDKDDILSVNHMSANDKLAIGDKLIIPGASIPNEAPKPSAPKGSSITSIIKNIGGYFLNPVPSARKSRGSTATHQGVDLAAPSGTPIRASASGTVIFARKGTNADSSNGGYGTLVIISHPNGTETLYAHMSRLGTSVGATVGKGETIGYVGNTGRSTGPHLHFEVRGAKNPGNDWSWGE